MISIKRLDSRMQTTRHGEIILKVDAYTDSRKIITFTFSSDYLSPYCSSVTTINKVFHLISYLICDVNEALKNDVMFGIASNQRYLNSGIMASNVIITTTNGDLKVNAERFNEYIKQVDFYIRINDLVFNIFFIINNYLYENNKGCLKC